jgi:MFS family permease
VSATRILLGASVGWLGISMISDGLPALLLPYRLATQGATDATTLGLVTLVGILLAAVLQPVAGWWSDRIGRVPVMSVGAIVAVGGLLGLSAATGMLAIAGGAVAALIGVSIIQAGQQTLLPDHVAAPQRGLASGLKGAFDVGGALLGFILLAALLGSGDIGTAAALLIAVLVGATVLGLALLWRRTAHTTEPTDRSPAYRSSDGPLFRLIAQRFVFLLGIYVVGRFLFTFVGARFGLSADDTAVQAGLVLTVLTAATVLASIPAGWLADRLGRAQLMQAGGMLAAAGIALTLVTPSVAVLVIVGALIALGSAAFSAGSWATLSDLAAGPESGRNMGLAQLGTAGAAAAAGAFGIVIDTGERLAPGLGFAAAFVVAAGCALVGGILWRQTETGPSALPVQVGR